MILTGLKVLFGFIIGFVVAIIYVWRELNAEARCEAERGKMITLPAGMRGVLLLPPEHAVMVTGPGAERVADLHALPLRSTPSWFVSAWPCW
jgi:hypothetical protein